MQKKEYRIDLVLMIVGACLTALTIVQTSLGIFEWLTMIPLFIGLFRFGSRAETTLRQAYFYGFLTLFAYNFVLYHWFLNLYPLDFAGLDNAASALVVMLGWIGLSLLQALPGGLIFVAYCWMQKQGVFEKIPILRPFAFGALWIVWEWSATLTWAGVPWGRLALGQMQWLAALQSASLLGSYFVSALILSVNGLLAYAIFHRARAVACVVSAAALLVCNFAFGYARLSQETLAETEKTVKVGVIQGNINSHEKWDENSYPRMKRVHADLTRKAVADGAQLIVWAETALPYTLNKNEDLSEYVSSLAKECDVTIIVGAFYTDEEGKDYNALYCVMPDGTIKDQVYTKRHLVPFGEFVPMKTLITTLIPPLADLAVLDADLTQGEDSALFETEMGKIGSLICFDSIYEELTRQSVADGAEMLVLSSNDSWFRDSAAVYMHQAQAQLRAIESGRCIARSANTGISTVISERGELRAWIDPLEKGYAVAQIETHETHTFYTAVGNLLVYLCIAFDLGLIVYGSLLKRKRGVCKD